MRHAHVRNRPEIVIVVIRIVISRFSHALQRKNWNLSERENVFRNFGSSMTKLSKKKRQKNLFCDKESRC